MRSRGGRPRGTRGLGSRGPSAGAGRPGAARGGREQGPAPGRGREARQRRGPRGLLSLSPCRGAANAAATAWRVTPGSQAHGRPHPSRPGPPSSPFAFWVGEEALALRGRRGVGPLPSPREGPASLGAGTRSFSNVPWAGGRGAWPGEGPWPGRRPSPPGRRARPRAALPHCSEGAWGWGCLCGHGACASEAAC